MGRRARTETEGVDAHTALLDSAVGQTLVAVLVFVMSIWIVGPNMPASPLREVVDFAWSPATNAGLDQSWSVFSPNPRDQTIHVVATLEYDDGTMTEWTVPDFDPVIGALRSYRWRKWQERVRLDKNERYWESSAAWIADNNLIDGERPRTVRLLRRWTVLAPLTADGIVDNGSNEYEFYVWSR